MTENPYATPEADPASHVAPAGEFDLSTAISDGLRLTKDNLGLWIGGMLLFGLVTIVSAVTVVGLFVVVPVLVWGYMRFLLNMYEGKAQISDLFSGFSKFGVVLGPMLVLFVLFSVLGLIGNSVQILGDVTGSSALSGLGGLIYLVFTFAVMVRLYFASYYLVDQDISAVESLKASWAATDKMKGRVIGFTLLSGLIAISGVLLLGIGVLFTSGISTLAWTSAYRQMNPTRG